MADAYRALMGRLEKGKVARICGALVAAEHPSSLFGTQTLASF